MKPTRPRVLVAIAAVCAAAAWLAVRASFSSLPPLPWTAVPALLVIAVGEMLLARNVRARMRGSGKPLAAHISGNPEAGVIPGMVLISLNTTFPAGV